MNSWKNNNGLRKLTTYMIYRNTCTFAKLRSIYTQSSPSSWFFLECRSQLLKNQLLTQQEELVQMWYYVQICCPTFVSGCYNRQTDKWQLTNKMTMINVADSSSRCFNPSLFQRLADNQKRCYSFFKELLTIKAMFNYP